MRPLCVHDPPGIPDGVVFGPVSTFNYNGDFGYWFDAPGVRSARGSCCDTTSLCLILRRDPHCICLLGVEYLTYQLFFVRCLEVAVVPPRERWSWPRGAPGQAHLLHHAAGLPGPAPHAPHHPSVGRLP